MILYCIRHCESAYNAEGRIQGQQDPPLSALGRRQSELLAAALAQSRIEAVYSSPLRRSLETAEPLARTLNLPVRVLEGLKELNAGIFQGHSWEELPGLFPAEAARWTSQDPDYRIPDGESRRELMLRGRSVFDEVRRGAEKEVAVVSHGGIMSAAFKSLLDIPAERNPFTFYNGSINILSWSSQVKLLAVNQVDHLRRPDGQIEARSGDL